MRRRTGPTRRHAGLLLVALIVGIVCGDRAVADRGVPEPVHVDDPAADAATFTEAAAGAPIGGSRRMASRISGGRGHVCAVVSFGAVRCWGENRFGQLGLGTNQHLGDDEQPSSAAAVQPGGASAVAVAAGGAHSCAVSGTGQLRCWGANADGELGYGSTQPIGDDESLATLPAVNLGFQRRVDMVATGPDYTCALLRSTPTRLAQVRCWGYNHQGALLGLGGALPAGESLGDDELPTTVDPIRLDPSPARFPTAIAAGGLHACALLDDGSVRCWGDGRLGVLGLASSNSVGDDEHPADVPPIALGGTATAIAAGTTHMCAILDDGSVRCWGDNDLGQLGRGDRRNIGDDETPGSQPPVDLGPGRTAVAIAAGDVHTCALLDDGSVRCWGGNDLGQLGRGDLTWIGDDDTPGSQPPVELGPGRSAVAITNGAVHSCAVLDDGSVRCWGAGLAGRLGTGSTVNIGDTETPGSVPPISLGSAVALTTLPNGAPTASVTSGSATVSWEPPASFGFRTLAETTATVTASTGASTTVPAAAGSARVGPLPTGVPVTFTLSLSTVDGTATSAPSPPVAAGVSRFVPLPPTRLLDTRIGIGVPARGNVPPGSDVPLSVLDRGGVPASDVTAVVLNVTATDAAGPGFVTAYPNGVPLPLASNLNLERAGQTVPNLVTVGVGDEGVVRLFSSVATHLVADVLGYYTEAPTAVAAGRVVPVDPTRILDTRATAAVAGGAALEVQAVGAGPVPTSGVAGVILNVTATEPQAPGFLTIYPTGLALPEASNVNYSTGQTVPNQVIVPVGTNGRISVFSLATAHVIIDVAGWITDGSATPSLTGLFVPTTPTRTLDTRSGPLLAPNGTVVVPIGGRANAPATGVSAAVLNVTATQSLAPGFVTAFPTGTDLPLASNVNVERAGQTVPNHAVVRTGGSATVELYTSSGGHLIADLTGWYLG